MADLETAYENTTSAINSVVTTQLSSSLSWANIPGSLVKADSSTAGFVWGFNSNNQVYVCAAPCTGNWALVDVSPFNVSTVQDLVTDASNVYILMTDSSGKSNLLMGTVMNTGGWMVIPIPFSPVSIFSTNTYLWVQDAKNVKKKCAKPCTTGNWLSVPDNQVTITSATPSELYGKDSNGTAVKTDELMQSPWAVVGGFSSLKMKSILGQNNDVGIYGIDTSSNVVHCEGDCLLPQEVHPVDTGGYTPLQLSADGSNLWMTSEDTGPLGNIFTRAKSPDYSTIMNNITPTVQERNKIVSDIDHEYNKQTGVMSINKQIEDIITFLKKLLPPQEKKNPPNLKPIEDNIVVIQSQLDQINSTQPIIQQFLVLIAAVGALYFLGSFLGWIIHIIAVIGLVGGIWYIISTSKQ
jgi:hypothetical protein